MSIFTGQGESKNFLMGYVGSVFLEVDFAISHIYFIHIYILQ